MARACCPQGTAPRACTQGDFPSRYFVYRRQGRRQPAWYLLGDVLSAETWADLSGPSFPMKNSWTVWGVGWRRGSLLRLKSLR